MVGGSQSSSQTKSSFHGGDYTKISSSNSVHVNNKFEFPPLSFSSVVKKGAEIENPRVSNPIDEEETIFGSNGNRISAEIGVFGGKNPNPKENKSLSSTPVEAIPQLKMTFTPPPEINGKRMVSASSKDFATGIKNCEDLVVGFFVEKRLKFSVVEKAVSKAWNLNKGVSMKLHGNCAFIFEFQDSEDRRKVLELGSFYISDRLFTLRPWSHLIEKSIPDIKSVPIWVMIFGIPLHMWNIEGLSLISSYLGKPILADEITMKKSRLAFARICIEIEVDFSYPASIPLLIDGKFAMELPVEYQWKPQMCETCKVFGHLTKSCSKKGKTKWTPKLANSRGDVLAVEGNAINGGGNVSMGYDNLEASKGKETTEGIGTTQSCVGGHGATINEEFRPSVSTKVCGSSQEVHVGIGGIASTTTHTDKVVAGSDNIAAGNELNMVSSRSAGTGVWIPTNAVVVGCDMRNNKENKNKRALVASSLEKGPVSETNAEKDTIASSSSEIEIADKDIGDHGAWTEVKGKNSQKKDKLQSSPKRNRDFTYESRFPINKVGAAAAKASSAVHN